MGQIMLPYINKIKSRGKVYYYYRRNGLMIPLPCDPATVEFMQAYRRIDESFDTGVTPIAAPGSIAALVEAFKVSTEFTGLKPRVKDLYHGALDMITCKLGKFPAHALTRRVALEWRDELAATPAKANNLLSVLKRIYSFGIDRSLVKLNPIAGLKRLKTGEWRPWTIDEIAAFRSTAAPHMRLALDLALYTGQRLGDVVAMRWNQIENGGIHVRQEKTDVSLWIPMHRNLRAAIEETKAEKKRDDARREAAGGVKRPDAMTILTAAKGLSYKKENLKHKFKDAVRLARMADGRPLPEDLVFHGLRKTAAVMLAEAGCTREQIKAITGQGDEMAAYYTRQADQKKLASAAVRKLERKK